MTAFFPHFKLIPSLRWERGGEDLLTCHFSNKLPFQKHAVASKANRLASSEQPHVGTARGSCGPSAGASPGTRQQSPGQKGGPSIFTLI